MKIKQFLVSVFDSQVDITDYITGPKGEKVVGHDSFLLYVLLDC